MLDLGIRKGDRVAVLDANSHRYMELYYGVPQIGAILLPINIRLTPGDIMYVLNDAEVKCLFVHQDMAPLVKTSQLDSLEKIIIMRDETVERELEIKGEDYEELLSHSKPILNRDVDIDENDPAEMFYTSGTTAKPKGMLHSHRMLYLCTFRDLFLGGGKGGMSDETIFLQAVPLFHANAWRKVHIVPALGARIVLVRQFLPEDVCEFIQRERVTYTELVPTMADMLTQFEDLDKYDVSSVQRILTGGATLSKATHEALIEKFPGAMVFTGYGMSETTSTGSTAMIKDCLKDISEEEKREKMRSQGFEDFFTQIRVVDPDGNDIKPDGKETGEIIFRMVGQKVEVD